MDDRRVASCDEFREITGMVDAECAVEGFKGFKGFAPMREQIL